MMMLPGAQPFLGVGPERAPVPVPRAAQGLGGPEMLASVHHHRRAEGGHHQPLQVLWPTPPGERLATARKSSVKSCVRVRTPFPAAHFFFFWGLSLPSSPTS